MRLLSSRLRPACAALAAALTTLSLTSCAPSEPRSVVASIEDGHVIIGTKLDQPGLGMRGPGKQVHGLDVDVARYVVNHIADARGVAHPEITFREAPSSQRETLINNGEVDFIAATYSMNKQRDDAVDFAGPYLLTHQALLVREGDDSIRTLGDLGEGKTLCSVTGSTAAKRVLEQLTSVKLQEYDSYPSCIEALQQGKVDAVTTDAAILAGFSAQRPGEFSLVTITTDDGAPLSDEYYGLGHAQGDTESTREMNAALEAMFADGSFDRFLADNFGAETAEIAPGVPGSLSELPQ